MGRTVAEGCLQTDNGITGKGTLEDRFAQTLFDCGEEVLGNGAADNFLGKLEAVAVDMLKSDPNIAELAAAAGLLLMSALDIGVLLTVSLYATLGTERSTSTPNLFLSLVTTESRCCSPRPERICSLVSGLVV
mgnify:CR=1 FL=1